MGQKRSREIYIDGYGKEHYVDEMETSHILNVVARLQDRLGNIQMVMLGHRMSANTVTNLEKAQHCVKRDIAMLLEEYGKRTDAGECC